MRAHGVSFVCTRDHLTLSNVGRRPELFEGQETPIARSCGLEGVVPKARRTILPSKTRCLSSKTALTIAAPRRYDASATTDSLSGEDYANRYAVLPGEPAQISRQSAKILTGRASETPRVLDCLEPGWNAHPG